MLGTDISDWRITFTDTGLNANDRRAAAPVRRHLGDDELFLANYGDTLTDAPLNQHRDDFTATDAVAASCGPARLPFHLVDSDERTVRALDVRESADLGSTAATSSSGGSLRLHRGARSSSRSRSSGWPRPGGSAGRPLRRLLGADGHAQGRARSSTACPRGRPPWLPWRSAGGAFMSDLSARLALPADRPPRCLAIGAHPDDIEIGAGGIILDLLDGRAG